MSAVSLRPYLPPDAPLCAAIFRAAIETAGIEDYSEEQCAAWAASANDAAAFAKRLSEALTLIAVIGGAPAGFASLKGADIIDMLYVDPAHARGGVATALIDALCRIAQARGAKRISCDASDTARACFERLGFAPQRRNLVQVDDQWLANTTMTKALDESVPEPNPTRH